MDPLRTRLALAAGLAAAAAGLGWSYLHGREQALLHRGREVKVLAARRYLPAYSRLEADQLTWRSLPEEYAPQGAVRDAEEALGMHTLVPFSAGEALVFNKLAASGPTLASAVPEGLRAFSLAVDEVTGVSHLLEPGDKVDVYYLPKGQGDAAAGALLQGAQVLAVGGRFVRGEEAKQSASTVTLALSPEDAELALYASSQGILHLGLRATGDARPQSLGSVGRSELQRRLAARGSASPSAPAALPSQGAIPPKR